MRQDTVPPLPCLSQWPYTAELEVCWAEVLIALDAAQSSPPSKDDAAMRFALAADLRRWVADLRDRCGFDTAVLEERMAAYIRARFRLEGRPCAT